MEQSSDRRSALKLKHRQSIIEAARRLIEAAGRNFTVDDLARRANVSRRTIFNHFISLDAVTLAVCADEFSAVVDRFLGTLAVTELGDGSRSSMFDEFEAAIRSADIAPTIASISRILDVPGKNDPKAAMLRQAALAGVAERLRDEVVRRHPAADILDAALLVDSLMSGVGVIAAHWLETIGPRLDQDALDAWDALLARLVHSVRSGYMPTD